MKETSDNSLYLCYEAVIPGLGFGNYMLSIIFIMLKIASSYVFITPGISDYSTELSLIILLFYLLNLIIRSNLNQLRLKQQVLLNAPTGTRVVGDRPGFLLTK